MQTIQKNYGGDKPCWTEKNCLGYFYNIFRADVAPPAAEKIKIIKKEKAQYNKDGNCFQYIINLIGPKVKIKPQ